MLDFEISGSVVPASPSTRCAVMGVGGAGGNTINAIINAGAEGLTCIAVNTDAQALDISRATHRIRIGNKITNGRGAGSHPEIGRAAAEEDLNQILEAVHGVDVVFLTGGLGGGTGSGALPVIAQALKERDILTVCLAIKPFSFEGKRRLQIADHANALLQTTVDTLVTISNEKLLSLNNSAELSQVDAFGIINGVISDCIRSIVDIMIKPGHINVDFADLKTIMKGMGPALMGNARARGSDRAEQAAHAALSSPFFDPLQIRGSRSVLINVTGNQSLGLQEIHQAASRVTEDVDEQATIIIGSVIDETMGDEMSVTVIATGFPTAQRTSEKMYQPFSSQQLHTTSQTAQERAREQDMALTKEHPLRDMLPSLEKRLKEHYALNQEELEIPTLLRKLMKEQQSNNQ